MTTILNAYSARLKPRPSETHFSKTNLWHSLHRVYVGQRFVATNAALADGKGMRP